MDWMNNFKNIVNNSLYDFPLFFVLDQRDKDPDHGCRVSIAVEKPQR